MKPIIKVENLSKQYRLGNVGTGTLRNDLKRWWHKVRGQEDPFLKIGESNDRTKKGGSEYVWALKDINFEVMPGEVLGIIGKNGAGKSTLLKILSKVTGPTTGKIDFNGRIGSLLEVGTGFHPELTGRENIFLNGAILGMTKAEISSKLDEIIDFSGCERYIDTPVKRYSSGMTVRLGFAVAAHLEPEILVVDEVLAVGDAEFQKKAIGKMQDVNKNEGRTVLFVSHNLISVSSLCQTGIILKNGSVLYKDTVQACINKYVTQEEGISEDSFYEAEEKKSDLFLSRIFIIDENKQNRSQFLFNEKIGIYFEIKGDKLPENTTLSFTILDTRLRPIFTSHFLLTKFQVTAFIPSQFLLPGQYYIKTILHVPNIILLDLSTKMLTINIEDTGTIFSIYNAADLGVLNVPVTWISQF
jgi:lipopolysaccharide transport system ATP-binding protein